MNSQTQKVFLIKKCCPGHNDLLLLQLQRGVNVTTKMSDGSRIQNEEFGEEKVHLMMSLNYSFHKEFPSLSRLADM